MKIMKKKTLKIASNASNGAFQWAGFQWTLLLGVILLSFQFVGNLQAQDSQTSKIGKGGWFIGLTPYALGLSESKTSVRITGVTPTGAIIDSSGGGFSFTAVAPSDAILGGGVGIQANAQADAVRLCKTGAASTDGSNTSFSSQRFALADGLYSNSNPINYNFIACKSHFDDLFSNATLVDVPFRSPKASPKPATAKWSGAGLHFGWQFPEGDRVGLQLHNWKGGNVEVSSQIAIYDYFFAKGFYAGLGTGTLQLKALGKTKSQRATAVNLGWQYSIKENLKLELGYLLLNGEVTVKKETRTTRNIALSSAVVEAQVVHIGLGFSSPNPKFNYNVACGGTSCSLLGDHGIKVTSEPLTREISQEYEIIETQEVTVSKPSVIYIRLSLGF